MSCLSGRDWMCSDLFLPPPCSFLVLSYKVRTVFEFWSILWRHVIFLIDPQRVKNWLESEVFVQNHRQLAFKILPQQAFCLRRLSYPISRMEVLVKTCPARRVFPKVQRSSLKLQHQCYAWEDLPGQPWRASLSIELEGKNGWVLALLHHEVKNCASCITVILEIFESD